LTRLASTWSLACVKEGNSMMLYKKKLS